ncbi:MAG: hypothetical protein Q7S60_03455 [bacterium]|nr:hypothetical protein [bacterium]
MTALTERAETGRPRTEPKVMGVDDIPSYLKPHLLRTIGLEFAKIIGRDVSIDYLDTRDVVSISAVRVDYPRILSNGGEGFIFIRPLGSDVPVSLELNGYETYMLNDRFDIMLRWEKAKEILSTLIGMARGSRVSEGGRGSVNFYGYFRRPSAGVI